MTDYRTVIFDLDGTLIDSEEGILNGIRYALGRCGKDLPEEKVLRRFLGPPMVGSFMRWCGMAEEDAVKATAYYREEYVDREGWRAAKVYPGIRALLSALREAGIRLAVATGKPEDCAIPILMHFDLLEYFDAVSCPGVWDHHPDKAVLIRRVLKDAPGPALMVGDIPGDIVGAREAGIDGCAALWGYGERDEVEAASPAHRCDSSAALSLLLTGSAQRKGCFITLEGVDGCGKTTQQHLLSARLRRFGYDTLETREPGGCPIAEEIRKIVLAKEENGMCPETEALLFAAARAQHVRDRILPAVDRGCVVLCDRYVDSSVVYQGAGRGLGEDWIRCINRVAFESGAPDLTVYLKMDHRTALSRREGATATDRIERSGEAFFSAAEKAYDRMAERERERFVTVDAAGTPGEIAEKLFEAVYARLKEAKVL